jgi:hypothetical protein
MASVEHEVKQLKHATHLSKSIDELSVSIQFALQTLSHKPQLIQFDSLIPILKREYFEINPKNVPTGQTVLQYSLPCL